MVRRIAIGNYRRRSALLSLGLTGQERNEQCHGLQSLYAFHHLLPALACSGQQLKLV
jgi:hypothetical protein